MAPPVHSGASSDVCTQPVDELPWCEYLDLELVRVDREQVVIAGDEHVGVVGGRQRDEVVIVGIAARAWTRRCGSSPTSLARQPCSPTRRYRTHLHAAGKSIPLALDGRITETKDHLEIHATTTADHRQLGMTWSPLGMLRAPSTLIVRGGCSRTEDDYRTFLQPDRPPDRIGTL